MGLTFVPTPLGNLRDITLRALEVLREADLIVAEDSRVTRRLLSAHGITGKDVWTYHEHNARTATPEILARAGEERVAVVTDAGMPGISDPGTELVAAAREAGVAVEVLPGPSAAVCVVALAGFPARRWSFEGFVPRATGERRTALATSLAAADPSVWYETPHRIRATLADLTELAPERRIFLVRELSKLHEQQILGFPADIDRALEEPVRGEIAFCIEGRDERREPSSVHGDATFDVDARVDRLLRTGASVSSVAKALASEGAGERRHLYARASERKRMLDDDAQGRPDHRQKPEEES